MDIRHRVTLDNPGSRESRLIHLAATNACASRGGCRAVDSPRIDLRNSPEVTGSRPSHRRASAQSWRHLATLRRTTPSVRVRISTRCGMRARLSRMSVPRRTSRSMCRSRRIRPPSPRLGSRVSTRNRADARLAAVAFRVTCGVASCRCRTTFRLRHGDVRLISYRSIGQRTSRATYSAITIGSSEANDHRQK